MTKQKKLLDKFLADPKDFTWDELVKLLRSFNYTQIKIGKTSGSRVRFLGMDDSVITLHKPHPSPVLKRYQIRQIIDLLKQEGML